VKSAIGSGRLRRGKKIKEGRAYDVKNKLILSLKYINYECDKLLNKKEERNLEVNIGGTPRNSKRWWDPQEHLNGYETPE
jgi:hypothetical protein